MLNTLLKSARSNIGMFIADKRVGKEELKYVDFNRDWDIGSTLGAYWNLCSEKGQNTFRASVCWDGDRRHYWSCNWNSAG